MATKNLREDKIRRIIEITAEYLGRKLTQADLLEILERCRKPGRPRRRAWTDEQLLRLERVRLDWMMKRATSPTHAAFIVGQAAPFTGKTGLATYHWLRRHFPEYRRESSAPAPRRGFLAAVARELEAEKKRGS